jgi:hypothetical protein
LSPPKESNFNSEIVTPTVTASTPKVTGTPAVYYFARNASTATGNYLTTFAAFVPSATFSLVSDGLYSVPPAPPLAIVEIYPDASLCSPFQPPATCSDYVKMQNTSSAELDLSHYRLRTGTSGQSATPSNTSALSGVLGGGHFFSVPITLSASGSWVWLEDAYGTTKYDQTSVGYPSSSGYDTQAWSLNPTLNTWSWNIYPNPADAPNTFAQAATVNQCYGLKINEIAANLATEDQFIEIQNETDILIDLTGCVIQTNRSTTKQFVFGSQSLEPGAVTAIYIKDTDLTLTKTTSGTVYILSSDSTNEVDSVDYDSLAENTSWATVNGDWQQTYGVTPNGENIAAAFPACEQGYERNLETGNCNKTATVQVTDMADCGTGKYRSTETNRCRTLDSSVVTTSVCDEGQYRNPATNRCKSLVSTTSVLTPCAANQIRSPDTNRCRAATATTSDVKPCAANQERNPATNRCRNASTTATKSDFPVQTVAQTGEATLGWWAFGGAGTLAVGYAGWEWRREVLSVIRRFFQFASGKS